MVWFFFFNDTATTEIYTLSLHDALPISGAHQQAVPVGRAADHILHADVAAGAGSVLHHHGLAERLDRKSTRLNSSHANISYAVFCLKKKKCTSNSSVYSFPICSFSRYTT